MNCIRLTWRKVRKFRVSDPQALRLERGLHHYCGSSYKPDKLQASGLQDTCYFSGILHGWPWPPHDMNQGSVALEACSLLLTCVMANTNHEFIIVFAIS